MLAAQEHPPLAMCYCRALFAHRGTNSRISNLHLCPRDWERVLLRARSAKARASLAPAPSHMCSGERAVGSAHLVWLSSDRPRAAAALTALLLLTANSLTCSVHSSSAMAAWCMQKPSGTMSRWTTKSWGSRLATSLK